MDTPPLWRILLHLYAFAQLGVLTRIVLDRLFSGPCSGNGRWNWAPCVTGSGLLKEGSTLFYDLPPNVLGSFIIGLLSAGSTLSFTFPRMPMPANAGSLQLLLVPAESSLQKHGALHIGLRTGYCGSLTTFSSWFMQIVMLFVGRSLPPGTLVGTQWPQALWALYLGLAGALVGLVLGQHVALAAGALLVHAASRAPGSDKGSSGGNKPAAEAAAAAAALPAASAAREVAAATVADAAAGAPAATAELPPPVATREPGADVPAAASIVVLQVDGGKGTTAGVTITATPPSPSPWSPACLLADLGAVAVALTLTGVSAAYAYLDRPPATAAEDRRFWWFAILFGPPGCFLRWYLSRFNALPASWGTPAGGGGWGWLQLGTFGANMSGCVVDFVCQAMLFRLAGSLSNTQTVALQGLMVGTAGCLSTVSTWVVELQKLSLTSPLGAHYYFSTSALAAIALGLLIYGIPVWMSVRP